MIDENLRRAALDVLGPFGDPTAREALEGGELKVIEGVDAWEGSRGTIRGDRVIVRVPAALAARISASLAAQEDLTRAISAALATTGSVALCEVAFDIGEPAMRGTPYRVRA